MVSSITMTTIRTVCWVTVRLGNINVVGYHKAKWEKRLDLRG